MTTLNADEDRAGVDLDTTEGQAQTMPVGGQAAVYEPGGDEDDDLIEGGEEYEEGDYDDELEGEGDQEGEAIDDGGVVGDAGAEEGEGVEGEAGVDVEDVAGGVAGVDGEEEYDEDEDQQQGEDEDPYGVDGYVEGIIGGNEEYDPEAEAEAEGMSCLNQWGEG